MALERTDDAPTMRLHYATHLRLAAVPSAVSCSRMFIRQTLQRWKVPDYIDDVAELVVSELVTNAVKMTGITDPQPKWTAVKAEHVIGVQLRIIDARLYVEVWDRSTDAPVKKDPDDDAEGGRGLLLIEAMAERWDVYRPQSGGKVVWAEVLLTEPPNPPPLPAVPVRVPGETKPRGGPAKDAATTALMQRVLDGLLNTL
ncbi:Anti-sigma regulatory factor (Ser/Thr protein kinase) [Streptomyces sp. BpilaLS-43]|uniref:ATP-binding protein n=1 Tax=Streptomyces sp. BpilaLS-43 TaxID=1839778 RepID=UPI00081BAB1A|nr:ATP-binding protein [Streptomyces sp. BpilaLS-43]SCD47596.1 Anti-sigma regulatory factor (Ser/Thr protein kinase) [Streptomyces sp. BpilaLS-43]